MNKKEICDIYRNNYHQMTDDYKSIDSNIKPLVDWLRKQGFITFASCGSHIRDSDGKSITMAQAYVAFFYDDANKANVEKLKAHKFPKSKYYWINISDMTNDYGNNRVAIDIIFTTKYNRIYHLKRIYNSLGISYPNNMKLDRHCKINDLKTIYKPEHPQYNNIIRSELYD